MDEYLKKKLLVIAGIILIILCVALVIIGQRQTGQARSYEAQFEGEDGRYMARNFTNRALGGLGRDSQASRVQQWRTQKYPGAEATSSTNPTGAGVDMNPVGGMGEHTHDNE